MRNEYMQEWKDFFTKQTLKKGQKLYESHCVHDLLKTHEGYCASVDDTKAYHVDIYLFEGDIAGVDCTCPQGKLGNACRHAAATLLKLEYCIKEQIDIPMKETSIKPTLTLSKEEQQLLTTLKQEVDQVPFYLVLSTINKQLTTLQETPILALELVHYALTIGKQANLSESEEVELLQACCELWKTIALSSKQDVEPWFRLNYEQSFFWNDDHQAYAYILACVFDDEDVSKLCFNMSKNELKNHSLKEFQVLVF